jgi:hypothetical protein
MLSFVQIVALFVGAFYIFGGIVVMRAMALDRVMDQLLAALSDPTAPSEALKSRILSVGAYLTLAGGVALALLSSLAAAVFLANALWQGGYLLWAEHALPPKDDDEARGRRRTKNAFVVYLAATGFVLWLAWRGDLRPWNMPLQSYTIDVAIVAGAIGIALAFVHWSGRAGATTSTSGSPSDAPELQSFFERMPVRLRLAPEWGCSPLWDADTGEPVSVYAVGLSFDLAERIETWDDTWQTTYNSDDPASSGFKDDAEAEAYRLEGREIVAVLRAVWQGELVVQQHFE